MTSIFTPDPQIKSWISAYTSKIRGCTASQLYSSTKLFISDSWSLKGFVGITVSDDTVIFEKSIRTISLERQAARIFHELVHVAQYRDFGWLGFVGTYFGQWIRSGFSYNRMKDKGLEHEAILRTSMFVIDLSLGV